MVAKPVEECDLEPQKVIYKMTTFVSNFILSQVCRHVTKLVPRLRPEPECVLVPQQVCDIKHVNTRLERVPYTTLWCQDDEDIETWSDSARYFTAPVN